MAERPARITASRAAGWIKPPGAVYVTRATIFGNPWTDDTPSEFCTPAGEKAGWIARHPFDRRFAAEDVVEAFDAWLRLDHIRTVPGQLTSAELMTAFRMMHRRRTVILAALPGLAGRALCCTCAQGQPCHADALIRLANEGVLL